MFDTYNKEGQKGVSSFVCGVGDKVLIKHPFYYMGAAPATATPVEMKGFKVMYPELGYLEEPSSNEGYNAVVYVHEKRGNQIIEFIEAYSNLKGYLFMEEIAVHDHASIPQGGPAYATYYSESLIDQSQQG